MHIVIIISILLTVAGSTQAQLTEKEIDRKNWRTIGELKHLTTTRAKLEYKVSGGDTLYFLLLKDDSRVEQGRGNASIKYIGINFTGVGNTYLKFYELLKSFFTPENKKNKEYEKAFQLGDSFVHVQHFRRIAAASIMLSTKEGHILLSEREIDKLFAVK